MGNTVKVVSLKLPLPEPGYRLSIYPDRKDKPARRRFDRASPVSPTGYASPLTGGGIAIRSVFAAGAKAIGLCACGKAGAVRSASKLKAASFHIRTSSRHNDRVVGLQGDVLVHMLALDHVLVVKRKTVLASVG